MKKPDYSKENYCTICDRTLPKEIIMCEICNHKVRTVPHAGGSRTKYIREKGRY